MTSFTMSSRRLACVLLHAGALVCDSPIDPSLEDFGRPIAAQLRAERTLHHDVISRKLFYSCRYIAAAAFAGHNPGIWLRAGSSEEGSHRNHRLGQRDRVVILSSCGSFQGHNGLRRVA